MSRRRVGIHGLHQHQQATTSFQRAGQALASQHLQDLQTQLQNFKTHLVAFAQKHKKEIKSDPVFRARFQRMCTQIGIDPLASNKGFWADLLGVGDFYYALGIQIVEVCMATRGRNGGLIEIGEIRKVVEKARGERDGRMISEDDITRAINALQPLGSQFSILTLGTRKLIQSVPRELNEDANSVLAGVLQGGGVSAREVSRRSGWEGERAQRVLDDLLKDGICWIDLQADPVEYWVASFFGGESS
ncbi:EAP30/Vps36 family-domain-containing protein [Phlyctochytrium arcticum]|nr:EAP30/Vps36 family-domain-containing protein [Phlyctochytrium arcticum]